MLDKNENFTQIFYSPLTVKGLISQLTLKTSLGNTYGPYGTLNGGNSVPKVIGFSKNCTENDLVIHTRVVFQN